MTNKNEVVYDKRHGGPWERGVMDSYYRRGCDPHYYKEGTYSSPRVERKDMTEDEVDAYIAGFNHNEEFGDFKEW
jgi:hypothetical protein